MARVLIVEDDVWMADCYALWLRTAGHDVLHASDAQVALDILDEYGTDVVVLDMLLPHANGIQLLQTIRSHTDFARLPVILCSGSLPRDLPALDAYGVRQVIDKATISPSLLRRAVSKVTRHAAV